MTDPFEPAGAQPLSLPRVWWGWVVMAMPGIVLLTTPLVQEMLFAPYSPREAFLALEKVTFPLAALVSLLLGFRIAWGETTWLARIIWAAVTGAVTLFINCVVTLAGCGVIGLIMVA